MSYNLDDPNQYAGAAYSPALAMDPASIQNGIVARLQAQQAAGLALANLANIEIAAFPDNPEDWRAVNATGTVLVRYEGSDYRPTVDTGIIAQVREMKFAIGILARGLGWSDAAGTSTSGAYAILEACRTALLGYKVPGAIGKTWAKDDEFRQRDRQGGVYVYALTVVVPSMVVEVSDAETIPTFTRGTIINTVGDSAPETVDTENGAF